MAMEIDGPHIGLRSERGPILAVLMLTTALIALDSTAVATASSTMATDLGGHARLSWLLAVYFLGQAVTVPIYGKVADRVGRKPVMLFGIAVFSLASVLCGVAWSMPALIVFRAVQGLGAGAIGPMSLTIAGDIYTVAERAKVQGYLAGVWAVSAMVGPTVGGVFSQYLSWRWIFLANVPMCALALWTLIRHFPEPRVRARYAFDGVGAALLAAGSLLVMVGLLEGGQGWAWTSAVSVLTMTAGAVLLVLFVVVERGRTDPLVPPWVLTRRVLVAGSVISAAVGAMLLGVMSYVSAFVEGVLGGGAVVAGGALAAFTFGWPLAASRAGSVYLRWGFRPTILIGGATALTGALLMLVSGPSLGHVVVCCLLMGAGTGLIAGPSLIAAQSTVEWAHRGVVTSTNMFARSVGSALGAAAFGAVVHTAAPRPAGPGPGTGPGADGASSPSAQALNHGFLVVIVAAALIVVAALFMPGRSRGPATPTARGPATPTARGPATPTVGGPPRTPRRNTRRPRR
ncbi:MFS transporter [Rhodococcus cerastii]|nr:MFS transporter [Rhodococcus cerastii]